MRKASVSGTILSALIVGACSGTATAPSTPSPQPAAQAPGGNATNAQRRAGPRPFRQVVPPEARVDSGLFTLHRTEDRLFFQIPDSLLGREMLAVSRIAQVPPDFPGFQPAGYAAHEQVLIWERQGNRVLLRKRTYARIAPDSMPIALSVTANNFEPVVAAFDVAAIGPDSASVVIDVTQFYSGDTPAIGGLTQDQRRIYGVRRVDDARSFISHARAFPLNVDVRHTLTYDATTPPSNANTSTLSMEMNQSLVLLPASRCGRATRTACRLLQHHARQLRAGRAEGAGAALHPALAPGAVDPAAYARGELVEPVKPIVYYLDPATPNEYRSCVRAGVEDWQPAFETAGFRNAIIARSALAAEDPDWHPEDVRYSVVRWAASLTRNAQGPSTSDPRTGEIIESDIVWYHNHLRSYRNRLMIETGAANPARAGCRSMTR
jgi:hypothetical protein